jgi:phosphoribosylaminoimidazolecarboxamide formyltransferase/IMP cyclohydrolase
MNDLVLIKRALISVSDKTNVIEFARALTRHGAEIISTGGTAKALREAGLTVRDVSEVTGFPEMMDGRVKTLHPKIHGALLGLRDNTEHQTAMRIHDITPIDMIVVNLYPFEQTVAKENVTLEDAIENIDIGGPAMIRSASKNWRDVAVVTDARMYNELTEELDKTGGALSLKTRQKLATLAYTRTASYDLAISSNLAAQLSSEDLDSLEPFNPLAHLAFFENTEEADADSLGGFITIDLEKSVDLRYGENPHQQAAVYLTGESGGVANAIQLGGKEMSFNNYVDAEAAWSLVNDFPELACAIIKHTNPSGAALGANCLEAYNRALETDPVSAFGGIVAFNQLLDKDAAVKLTEIFTEVVIAPDFTPDALEILKAKKNLRILQAEKDSGALEFRTISGGMLAQTKDSHQLSEADLKIVTKRQPTESEIRAMLFAWNLCKHVRSNAIVFANESQTIGVGAGQMNRIDSVRIAAMRAARTELKLQGSVLASDAFFPFRDGLDEAASHGIAAVIQPGGSVRDDEVIAAADEHGLAMAFTGIRHFKH